MAKKMYVSPLFEQISLWDGEVNTSSIFKSVDNDFSWDWITNGNGQIVMKGRMGER